MARVGLDEDERWPDYLLLEPGDTYATVDADVPDEQLARWRKVIAEYEAVQDEMRDAMEEALAAITPTTPS
jgi:hypothetical protein